MKPQPIFEVVRRISVLAPAHQATHLSALIKLEGQRSHRRRELEALLKDIVNTDLQASRGTTH